jgi:hypothetical protein
MVGIVTPAPGYQPTSPRSVDRDYWLSGNVYEVGEGEDDRAFPCPGLVASSVADQKRLAHR